jgi:hypothetical protein
MQGLLFLSRVTFICNLLFIICLLIRHTHFTLPDAFAGFVVLAGWMLSVLLNLIITIAAVVVGVVKKNLLVPFWLVAMNTFFFFFQLIYRFIFTF